MSLERNFLVDAILALQNSLKNESDTTKAQQKLAEDLADAIIGIIKKGKVTIVVPPGTIQVQGSPSAQTNASPITLTGDPNSGTGGIT